MTVQIANSEEGEIVHSLYGIVLVAIAKHHRQGGLNNRQFIFSQLRMLEVQDQGVERLVSRGACLLGVHTPSPPCILSRSSCERLCQNLLFL